MGTFIFWGVIAVVAIIAVIILSRKGEFWVVFLAILAMGITILIARQYEGGGDASGATTHLVWQWWIPITTGGLLLVSFVWLFGLSKSDDNAKTESRIKSFAPVLLALGLVIWGHWTVRPPADSDSIRLREEAHRYANGVTADPVIVPIPDVARDAARDFVGVELPEEKRIARSWRGLLGVVLAGLFGLLLAWIAPFNPAKIVGNAAFGKGSGRWIWAPTLGVILLMLVIGGIWWVWNIAGFGQWVTGMPGGTGKAIVIGLTTIGAVYFVIRAERAMKK